MLSKFLKLLMSIFLAIALLNISNAPVVMAVSAIDYNYPMQCDTYEVDIINDDGSFSSKGCYNDFETAKAKMNEIGIDAVVRHNKSYSPTKIIAMSSGTAYSYPARNKANTITIDQYYPAVTNMKSTYTTNHREMHYFDTVSYDGNGNGKVHIVITGFDGYTDLKTLDLIPTKYSEKEIAIKLGGNGVGNYYEDPFITHIYQSEYVVERNGNYNDLVFYWYSGWSGSSTYPSANRHVVGQSASWMQMGTKYYSYDGYTFYYDKYYKNYAGTYYNYYQFLPLRSQSNISGDTLNRFLTSKGYGSNSKLFNMGQVFVNGQNTYGVNALLVYSMACLESAYGTSSFAIERNNLFGWNAFDSDPGQASYFASIEQAVNEHMGINLRGYLDINDYRFFGTHLGNKGSGINLKYAADPYWGYKIASIAYEIDKFANNYDGNLTDYDAYAVGVINTYNIPIKQSASDSSKTLYESKYGATYQMNFMVTILNEENGFIKTNTTNPLNGSTLISGLDAGLVAYPFSTNVGYINSKYVDRVNSTKVDNSGTYPTGDYVFTIDGISIADNKIVISGSSYQPGIYVTDENSIKHVLNVYDNDFNVTSIDMTSSSNKDVSGYNVALDVSDFNYGTYQFSISTTYSKYSDFNDTTVINTDKLPAETNIADKTVSFELKDNIVFMTLSPYIQEVECGDNATYDDNIKACVCNSGYEGDANSGCTLIPAKPLPEEKQVASYILKQFDYKDDTNVLVISGLGFISGSDANEDSDIKHQIVLTNLENNKELVLDAITSMSDPFIMGDGYNYEKIGFNIEIDLDGLIQQLLGSDYSFKLRITNGTVTKDVYLKNVLLKDLPDVRVIDKKNVYFSMNSLYEYRYELNINKYDIDWTIINKPTFRNSFFSADSFKFDDNANLILEGAAWIYNTNYENIDDVQYQILLVNNEDKSIALDLEPNTCKIDYQQLLSLSYNYANSCFNSSISLQEVPDGHYVMYLKAINKDSIDIYEMTKISGANVNISVTKDNREYKIVKVNTRNRYELTIETKQ